MQHSRRHFDRDHNKVRHTLGLYDLQQASFTLLLKCSKCLISHHVVKSVHDQPLCCREGALARAVQETVRRACGGNDPLWVAIIYIGENTSMISIRAVAGLTMAIEIGLLR